MVIDVIFDFCVSVLFFSNHWCKCLLGVPGNMESYCLKTLTRRRLYTYGVLTKTIWNITFVQSPRLYLNQLTHVTGDSLIIFTMRERRSRGKFCSRRGPYHLPGLTGFRRRVFPHLILMMFDSVHAFFVERNALNGPR